MKIVIDYDVCEAHGRCFENAYEVFDEGPGGKGVAKTTDVSDDDFDMQRAARSAAMMCPMGAILIEEDE
jgi:ferredoxin